MSKMREIELEKDRLSLFPIPLPLFFHGRTPFYAKSMNLGKTRRKMGERKREKPCGARDEAGVRRD